MPFSTIPLRVKAAALRKGDNQMKGAATSFLILLAILCVGLPAAALADCSSEDRIEMAEEGLSEAQIDAQCNSGQNYFAPPQSYGTATTCVTQAGSCELSQSGQLGGACYCQSPNGPIYGVAR